LPALHEGLNSLLRPCHARGTFLPTPTLALAPHAWTTLLRHCATTAARAHPASLSLSLSLLSQLLYNVEVRLVGLEPAAVQLFESFDLLGPKFKFRSVF
jgi:hypothetical protein